MKISSQILDILEQVGIDPEVPVETDSGTSTAFDVLNNHIAAGLDEITENSEG